ncbi:asparagine synthase (glutamine-hydrolyzing) [Paenibacillus ginsengarvi]|uniref:asparagine synthase (glutamine-hydrolyzing) n=1 Tax=Paenibacillus ginsengarvi TaxID=400777 RepID=A0A3B0CJ05_9BACL|nr:asparagine synthase (glutamine-hydrolyzing) [Paenibacillus ginsengarvi]RKN85655.1 asparagine synthase (glutamine-hydrolyzing) [Paenibacillus ginsengarvi]
MCGIAGFVDGLRETPKHELEAIITSMTNRIIHRGPDSSGSWTDPEIGVALGHRRLSIIDLSQDGHQPMISQSNRYVIVFNGEIYNYRSLRARLTVENREAEAHLRGHSDTEVMLACIEQWGMERSLEQFVGMFSFAIYDKRERKLYLARDRLGEKPLYYGRAGDVFLFGSELKALRAHPEFRNPIDRNALTLYLRHNYIPAPYSIFSSIHKLQPGCLLVLDITTLEYRVAPYWSVQQAAIAGKTNEFAGGETEAVDHLNELLLDTIRHQMVADVPLGAFLSGGIDSTTVVALMQSISERPVKTFTIGFHEQAYNEAMHAKTVASYLGTDHTELYVTSDQAMNIIPILPSLYDEPFSDSSQIPTFLVAQLARQHVTVSLSGDGGDELFGGYNRYFSTQQLWGKLNRFPKIGRESFSNIIRSVPAETWNRRFGWFSRKGHVGDRLHLLAEFLGETNAQSFYRNKVSHWKAPQSIVKGAVEPNTIFHSEIPNSITNYEEQMMYLDTVSYLPDDILVKVDRAGMGVSLESRIPLLDHRIVEFSWKLPLSMKIKNDTGKWLLRQILYRYVPKEIMDRPKQGFGVPIDYWLRGPLREWAEHLLDARKMEEQGYLYPAPIRQKWEEHVSGKRNWHYYLWDILMFQAWIDHNAS